MKLLLTMVRVAGARARAKAKGLEEVVNPILDDLETYASLESLQNTEGGKLLIKTLTADVYATIDALAMSYKKATHAELQALCATLQVNLDVLRSIKNARKNKELARSVLDEKLGADEE